MLERAKTKRRGSKTRAKIRTFESGNCRPKSDVLATEEPMEVRLVTADETKTVAVTMRTPGNDFELAAGFLYGEGIVSSPKEIRRISYCVDPEVDADQQYNIVNVEVAGTSRSYDLPSLERHFYTTSACGVCGKASLEQLELRGCPVIPPGPEVSAEAIYALPDKLREAQGLSTPRVASTPPHSSTPTEYSSRYARTLADTTLPTSWLVGRSSKVGYRSRTT